VYITEKRGTGRSQPEALSVRKARLSCRFHNGVIIRGPLPSSVVAGAIRGRSQSEDLLTRHGDGSQRGAMAGIGIAAASLVTS
jgi:hypothetical protein